jgi:hypothetical protein
MTPFIIWLGKQDLDNLIVTLIKSNDLIIQNDITFKDDELVYFTENLIQQNADLLKLLKKIDFSVLADKLEVQQIGSHQKCKVYQEQLKKILGHCVVYNSNFKIPIGSIELLGCNSCSLRDIGKHRNH